MYKTPDADAQASVGLKPPKTVSKKIVNVPNTKQAKSSSTLPSHAQSNNNIKSKLPKILAV